MSRKTTAFIVARLGSTRLPQKALLPILGRPMIERMIDRVREARLVDDIAIATTTLPEDRALVDLAQQLACGCYQGSPENVSRRVADAAAEHGADVIVELLADNPLVHSDLIDDVIGLFRKQQSDYAANVTKEYQHCPSQFKKFPIGIRVQVYTSDAAKRWSDFPDFVGHELGTTAFMFRNTDHFKCDYLEADGRWEAVNQPDHHLAVNYRKNYELVERIFEHLYPTHPNFSLPVVMAWIKDHPQSMTLMGS